MTIPALSPPGFAPFTRAHYRDLLKVARDKYTFLDFEQACAGPQEKPFLVWRHDIDMSVHAALAFAKMEAEEGIKATYFLLMHSQFYNLFEKDVSDRVREILALGHNVGLHFDSHFYDIPDMSSLETLLVRERRFLEEVFGVDIKVFSFHNTNEFTLGCRELKYGGMINAFGDYFQSKVAYCSDSNGIWRYQRLDDLLHSGGFQGLQVTTHPEFWTETTMSPADRARRCISGRAEATWNTWRRLLVATGRTVADD